MSQLTVKEKSQVIIPVSINSPFDMFLDDQWTWISENSDPYEYTELDEIYTYLTDDRQRYELPKDLQVLSDSELRQEYNRRFPVLFGKVLEALGKQLVNGEIGINIKPK